MPSEKENKRLKALLNAFDSNGAITPAGSYSMTYTSGVLGNLYGLMASFAPAGGSGGAPTPLLSLMGVGS